MRGENKKNKRKKYFRDPCIWSLPGKMHVKQSRLRAIDQCGLGGSPSYAGPHMGERVTAVRLKSLIIRRDKDKVRSRCEFS